MSMNENAEVFRLGNAVKDTFSGLKAAQQDQTFK